MSDTISCLAKPWAALKLQESPSKLLPLADILYEPDTAVDAAGVTSAWNTHCQMGCWASEIPAVLLAGYC